ncbi:hypothetical protein FGB62_37g222 [Gracilaria domingensis]|nr:hypothetical protein FGB62_635g00 [Gracilaria domingensis]KAI0556548.1 hypothetical protein FGB62_574g00 [Gracilaria domingensis]KAI0563529.1 hypothetical protein FGB62_37g222 [Gracilaria domingensis]
MSYVFLTLFINTVLELLLYNVLASKATLDILRGQKVDLFDSRYGLVSLHSVYWGRRRNRNLLLLLGAVVIMTEILFAFSFSTVTLPASVDRKVWNQPAHSDITSQDLEGFDLRASVFPWAIGDRCFNSSGQVRDMLPEEQNVQCGVGRGYIWKGTFMMRRPYLGLDNTSVPCGVSMKDREAMFEFPRLGIPGSTIRSDRLALVSESRGCDRLSSLFEQQATRLSNLSVPLLEREGIHVLESRRMICLLEHETCLVVEGDDKFVIVFTSGQLSELESVAFRASGEALEKLNDRNRRRRLMVALRINDAIFPGRRISSRNATRRTLTRRAFIEVAQTFLNVAIEEGVAGVRVNAVDRPIFQGTRQSATVRAIAAIPLCILILLAVVLLTADIILRAKVAHQKKQVEGLVDFGRVQLTKQWMREIAVEDLKSNGLDGLAEEVKLGTRHL